MNVQIIKHKESDISKAIQDYLQINRYFFWRANSMGVFDAKIGCYRKNPRQMRGIPDIFVFTKGILFGLEVKTEKGNLSEAQLEFSLRMKLNGGLYFVVTSVEDVSRLGL